MTDGARKDDNNKARYDLLPPEALEAVARILTFGAKTYGERNWEQGMKWGRVYGALMRHLWAWWNGERLDPDSGQPHLWHAACNIFFLIAYEERGVGEDDRVVKAWKCGYCGKPITDQIVMALFGQHYHPDCGKRILP